MTDSRPTAIGSHRPDPPGEFRRCDISGKVGSPGWWQQRLAADAAPRLTRQQIVATAVEVLDAEGLAGFSMRRVATALTGRPAISSLYRHVGSQQELLLEVFDSVLGELFDGHPETAPPSFRRGSWQQRARAMATALRDVLLRHPAVVPLAVPGQPLGPNAMRARDIGLTIFTDAGLAPESAALAYMSLSHFIIGATSVYLAADADDRSRAELAELYRSLPATKYPAVVRHADALAGATSEAEFEFGLRTLLAGIAAQL
ncbi:MULTISPECIES: TetR/AcrR family transcriptional regulator [unclassified Nocardia]|uniref:TetR/AcrR family transcriptional regulator n=1 Tax=unclassified Nocardia TaxID=2637762 RepID=UPI001CE43FFE|nr:MULTISPECIES: TetR/AcrR family transcriptional regulator C-terminal domain-containing protein [unclassified Nocardia]